VCAEMVDEGFKYNDCQTLVSRGRLNTKAQVNQIPYTIGPEIKLEADQANEKEREG